MIRAVDTSVLVAAFASWHADHVVALGELRNSPALIGHSLVEAFSVLTRLPEPQRAEPALVAEFLERNFPDEPLALDAAQMRGLPGRLTALGISGGAAYDGLIALTAHFHGVELVSLDRRAENTYRRCGINYSLLASG